MSDSPPAAEIADVVCFGPSDDLRSLTRGIHEYLDEHAIGPDQIISLSHAQSNVPAKQQFLGWSEPDESSHGGRNYGNVWTETENFFTQFSAIMVVRVPAG